MNQWFGALGVPGARMRYKVQGAGPVFLLLSPGAGDADTYDGLVSHLTDRYSVVTLHRRGYARSPLDDPEATFGIETHSDDAHRLLAELSDVPAAVFGSSVAALIALDLGVRHPEQVRTFVAHEPPLAQLLEPAERPSEDLLELSRHKGAAVAIRQFGASIGEPHAGVDAGLGLPSTTAEHATQNREAFFRTDAMAVARNQLDIDALTLVPRRIVVAGGRDGQGVLSLPMCCTAGRSPRAAAGGVPRDARGSFH